MLNIDEILHVYCCMLILLIEMLLINFSVHFSLHLTDLILVVNREIIEELEWEIAIVLQNIFQVFYEATFFGCYYT